MSEHHDHDHKHKVPADIALRVKALETALANRGYVNPETLDAIVDAYENRAGVWLVGSG